MSRFLRFRYFLLVMSLKLVVLVARLCGFKGHVLADAEGDSGYWRLGAHKTFGVGFEPAPDEPDVSLSAMGYHGWDRV